MRALIRAAVCAAMLLPCVAQAVLFKSESAGTIANGATYTGKGWSGIFGPTSTYAIVQFTTTATAGTVNLFVDTSADGVNWISGGGGTTGKTITAQGTYMFAWALASTPPLTWPAPYARVRVTNALTTQPATGVIVGILAN